MRRSQSFPAVRCAQSLSDAEEGVLPQATVARELGIDEGAAHVAVDRLRKRYRELLGSEIALTLSDDSQVNEEMRALLGAFAS